MAEWYRNREWTAAIAAEFEARLARSRAQKAQYLRIQGSTLKDSHPEVAVELLQRCVDQGDSPYVAHALLDKAHALYRMGKIDDALATLEATMAQEQREPMFRTSAPFDYAFLVALHGRSERYDQVLGLMDVHAAGPFAVMDFERESARAIILSERGKADDAREAARLALQAEAVRDGGVPGFPQVGTVPANDHPFGDRLRAIAAQEG